jgi:hypothetical protein
MTTALIIIAIILGYLLGVFVIARWVRPWLPSVSRNLFEEDYNIVILLWPVCILIVIMACLLHLIDWAQKVGK